MTISRAKIAVGSAAQKILRISFIVMCYPGMDRAYSRRPEIADRLGLKKMAQAPWWRSRSRTTRVQSRDRGGWLLAMSAP